MKSSYDVKSRIISAIEEKVVRVRNEVAGGSARDFAEYRHMCGRVRGLIDAVDIMNDVFKELNDDGDE